MITALVMSLCLEGAYPHTCTSEQVWVPMTWEGAGPAQEDLCREEKKAAFKEVRINAPRMMTKIKFDCETSSSEEE